MASKRKKTYLIGIAVALLLPLFSFLVFQQMSKGKIQLPKHYGIAFVDTIRTEEGNIRYDTFYRETEDVSLTNQLGKQVTLNKDLRGKILVINFFDTQDTLISPIVAANMHNIEQRFQDKAYKKPKQGNVGKDFQLVSITVRPAREKVPQIRTFADEQQVNSDHWWLLTGDSAAVYSYALKQLNLPLLKDGKRNPKVLSQIVLVDTFRHIRGYFNGLDTFQLSQLADDISIISMEKREK